MPSGILILNSYQALWRQWAPKLDYWTKLWFVIICKKTTSLRLMWLHQLWHEVWRVWFCTSPVLLWILPFWLRKESSAGEYEFRSVQFLGKVFKADSTNCASHFGRAISNVLKPAESVLLFEKRYQTYNQKSPSNWGFGNNILLQSWVLHLSILSKPICLLIS